MGKASSSLRALQEIPGVGIEISKDLYSIGIRVPEDLVGLDPVDLYEKLCTLAGCRIDRCLLYTLRCAVYYAETPKAKQDPRLLKWWNWKD